MFERPYDYYPLYDIPVAIWGGVWCLLGVSCTVVSFSMLQREKFERFVNMTRNWGGKFEKQTKI
jgi:hypothetical protein